jgi:DNA-binding NtrC family response regulator
MKFKPLILIIDDNSLVRLQFKSLLSTDFTVIEAATQRAALMSLKTNDIQLVVLDLLMPDVRDFELLTTIRREYPDVSIVMATVSDDPQMVLNCLKHGAKDYVFKEDLETNPGLLNKTIQEILDAKLERQWSESRVAIESDIDIFIPEIRDYQTTFDLALRAVKGGLSLVILGETGVGKGTLVTYIHQKLMPKKPLISIDCGAICHSLAEAELFGTERGAFTGAVDTRKGKFEMANGGILFLDEVGNLSRELQEKLLCALETKRVVRIGGHKEIQLDFTLITATNKDLEVAVKNGEFRSDLYYRIKQFVVKLPALKENPELIRQFSDHYISEFNQKYSCNFRLLAPIQQKLLASHWVGNLRELKNEIQIMVWLHSQGEIHIPRWATGPSNRPKEGTLNDQIDAIEVGEIKNALTKHNHNLSGAARELKIHRSTLQGKLRKHNIYPTKSIE